MNTATPDHEILNRLNNSFTNLRNLCQIYDSGNPGIAYIMAVEICNILITPNRFFTTTRKTKIFPNPRTGFSQDIVNAQNKMIIVELNCQEYYVRCFHMFNENVGIVESSNFKDWWKDIIHVAPGDANASGVGRLPGGHPIIPFEKRFVWTRRTFVDHIRDKAGAHIDLNDTKLLEELQKTEMLGFNLVCEHPDGERTTNNGTLPIIASPGAAMMRQISQEVLIAYGYAPVHNGWGPAGVAAAGQ
jgi:hypothetical protein